MATKEKEVNDSAWPQTLKAWENFFDALPDLIMILDNHYRIVRANRAMAERLDVTPRELSGEICYKRVHGTECPPDYCPHAQLIKDGKEHKDDSHAGK